MPTSAQQKATAGVGAAFSAAAPAGLTDAQKAAVAGVKSAFTPATPPPQPPSEPAVLSSSNIDDLNAQNKDKLTNLSTKGSTVGQDGNMYDSSGSMLSAPEGAVWDEASGQFKYNGQSYGAADFYGTNGSGGDEDWKAVQDLFAPLKASLDSATLGQVNAIQQQFEGLKADQAAYNAQAEKARSRALQVGGTSRYAPLSASGTMLAQTSYGLRQIASLDAQENSAIAQAQAAQQNGEMQLMDKAISMAENIRQQKQTQAKELMDNIQKANDSLQQASIQSSRDEAVAGLMSQGITDPSKILDLLNKNEDGTSTGGNFTADEIQKAIKNLVPVAGTDAAYKFTNTDVGKLLGSGMNAKQIQEVQDYYNGKTQTPPDLTAAQTATIQKVLGGAAAGGSVFKFTPTQVSELLSGNFTQTDIQKMQEDVVAHGIDAVVDGMPAAQKALVKRVLANADTVANIGSGVVLTRDSISKLYGIPDDSGHTGFLGTGQTNAQKLDAIADTIGRYRAVGYSDDDILKLLQSSKTGS